jgi:transcriptional repressor NrdR
LRGIVRACEKTGIAAQRLEELVEEIEAQLQQKSEREFSSNDIGELVLNYLKAENEVAYVRFASVYRQFGGIKDFVETLDRLQNNRLLAEVGEWGTNNMMSARTIIDKTDAETR